ncbi:uncharacterized protein MONBRDRAFT_28164 [Monosiga brevicollis MX1]|uniref:Condensin complex subunit 2 n=1 Tax=Monosiga brevicollis TaxID=81824 RepID=A9V7D8_MONBE|nr:uncharacterized protein MONBRDRAFT_28164 [Monosiga brevicollis MX1]EDQ86567.1 predicted protein [Monosiga brevicollis MX1]|eukprot:XP_001748680.1 hypothetical protein [Monosiga brevicollis MX1]
MSLRKSSAQRRLGTPVSPFSPGKGFRPNNDKLEKEARRRSVARDLAEKQFLASPYRSPRVVSSKSSSKAPGNRSDENVPSDITDIYANCIKLCTENKVNQKNTWQLPLIDYMNDVMQTRHGEMTNFQIASCTLDASVKIYSYRIDSIHSEAYKVLGGIARGETRGDDDEEDADLEDGQGGEEGENAKKRRKKRATNTLEKNPQVLNVKKFDLAFDVDPLFKHMSAAFDEGGARGLLLNHLNTRDDGALLFDSHDTAQPEATDPVVAATEAAVDELLLASEEMLANLEGKAICPSLGGFNFVGWEPSDDLDTSNVSTSALVQAQARAGPAVADLSLNMDVEGGFGNLDSDDDVEFDQYEQQLGAYDEDGLAVSADSPQPHGGMARALKLSLDINNDYSYFSEEQLKNWAGPSHWRPRVAAGAIKGAKPKATKKKERFYIDFTEEEPNWKTAFAKGKASTMLSATTLKKKTEDELLLPEDKHFKLDFFQRLFGKPNTLVKPVAAASAACLADAAGGDNWYDYNNPNDMNNFCGAGVDGGDLVNAGLGGVADDDDDDDVDLGDFAPAGDAEPFAFGENTLLDDTMMPLNQTRMMGTNGLTLIDQPNKVGKIAIDYAKQAKRVNVKALKRSIWTQLTDGTETPTPLETPVATGAPLTDLSRHHALSELVSDVPQTLPSKTASNLSVPIMFVCLLHLANEKHLKLSTGDMMQDLHIAQA